MGEESKPLEKVKDEVLSTEFQLGKLLDMLGKVFVLEKANNALLEKIRLDFYRIRATLWAVGGLLLFFFFLFLFRRI